MDERRRIKVWDYVTTTTPTKGFRHILIVEAFTADGTLVWVHRPDVEGASGWIPVAEIEHYYGPLY